MDICAGYDSDGGGGSDDEEKLKHFEKLVACKLSMFSIRCSGADERDVVKLLEQIKIERNDVAHCRMFFIVVQVNA